MKNSLIIFVLFLGYYPALASDTTILFQQVNHAHLFELAKKEQKGVMLYFHFDGCGACVKMEKTTFRDPKVVEYYNNNFINVEINTRKGEGIEINKTYNVEMHPTFLFFDHSGNETHKMVGVFSPEVFYQRANDALSASKNLTAYKRLYHAGSRSSEFLSEYVDMLRDAKELDSLVINEYLQTQRISDLGAEKNLRFLYEYAIHENAICVPFNSREFKFMQENKAQFARYFDLEQVNTRLMFIINTAVYDAIEKKDSTSFLNAIEALREYDNGQEYNLKQMDGRITRWTITKMLVLYSKMYFYEQIGDHHQYRLCLNEYVEKIWDDAEELNNFAWGVFEDVPVSETEKIQTAIKCSIRSIELKNKYAYNDTYAWLLYKSGEKQKALDQAQKTIEIARKNNQDYSETQKLVDLLANEK